jgi:signal transduction histidine kinase
MRTLRIINSKADSLNQLINDMLDVSRIERGELLLQREPFDLSQLVSEVVGYQALVHEEFEFNHELATQPVTINGDRQRIEQVLTNLIENAAKYSGNSRKVEVSTETRGLDEGEGEAVISVKDHGVGIPAHEQQRVFERFFQATNATSAHRSGLGLGLYITQGIVARHGGRMWLESAVGDGSTFYVALPLAGSGDRDTP